MNRKSFLGFVGAAVLSIAASTLAGGAARATDGRDDLVGAVYTMTNAPTANEVVIFGRDGKGGLRWVGNVPTGGIGSGGGLDPLASQGSLVLTGNKMWLLAVNAGSGEISVFRVKSDGLELTDKIASGGLFPTSLTVFQDLVYVLNAGGNPSITGFSLSRKGRLTPIESSTRTLPGLLNAQVGFDPRGEALVVTDRSNDTLVVFPIGEDGTPAADPIVSPSHGAGPFAFAFGDRRTLLVAEVGSNAVSSYEFQSNGPLQVQTPSILNGQAATCWIAVNRQYAFTANPGTQSLSSFRERPGQKGLALLAGVAGMGTTPLDLTVTTDGRFLYALDPGIGGIDAFRIEHDGSLTNLGPVPAGLAQFAQGIASM